VVFKEVGPPAAAAPFRFGGADDELRATSAHGSFVVGPLTNGSWEAAPCVIVASSVPGLTTCVLAVGAPITVAVDAAPANLGRSPTRAAVIRANATAAVASADGVTKLSLLLPNAEPSPVCPEGVGWRFGCECVDAGVATCVGSPPPSTAQRCRRSVYSVDADPFGATAAVVLAAVMALSCRGATAGAAAGLAAMLPVSAIVTQLPAVTAGRAGAAAAAGVMLGAHAGGMAALVASNARVAMAVAVAAGAAAAAATHHAGLYALAALVAGAGAAVCMVAVVGSPTASAGRVASIIMGMAVAPLIACTVTAVQTAVPELTPPIALGVASALAGVAAVASEVATKETINVSKELLAPDDEPPPPPPVPPPPPYRALAVMAATAAMAPAYWPGVFRATFAYAAVVIASTAADVAGRAVPGGDPTVAAAAGVAVVVATAVNVSGESSDLSEATYAAVVSAAAFARGRVVAGVATSADSAGRTKVIQVMVVGGLVGALGGLPALVAWH